MKREAVAADVGKIMEMNQTCLGWKFLLGWHSYLSFRQELGLGMAYTRRSAFLTASEVGIRLITLSIRLITLSSAADRSIADLMITPLATDQWGRANTDRCRLNLAPTSTHAVFRCQLLSLALKTQDQIHPKMVNFCLEIFMSLLFAFFWKYCKSH